MSENPVIKHGSLPAILLNFYVGAGGLRFVMCDLLSEND